MPLGPGRLNSKSTCGTKVGICQRINLYIASNLGNTHAPAVFEQPSHYTTLFRTALSSSSCTFPSPKSVINALISRSVHIVPLNPLPVSDAASAVYTHT